MEQPTDSLAYLGREFLTWLWFMSEERGGNVFLEGYGDIEIAFIRRIVLESGEGEYMEAVQCSGAHASLAEGRAALREGKKVKEARLQLIKGEFQWEFSFKGDEFRFQALRLPQMMNLAEENEGREGRVLERIALLQDAMDMMDRLFQHFLVERSGAAWPEEGLKRLREWIYASASA